MKKKSWPERWFEPWFLALIKNAFFITLAIALVVNLSKCAP